MPGGKPGDEDRRKSGYFRRENAKSPRSGMVCRRPPEGGSFPEKPATGTSRATAPEESYSIKEAAESSPERVPPADGISVHYGAFAWPSTPPASPPP